MSPTEIVVLVAALLAGACVGSLSNVVIDRLPLPLDEPNEYGEIWDTNSWRYVLGGESRCSSCGAGIRPWHLIPVLSWIVLRGRCRDCGERIPAFHPFVELAVPLIGLGMWASYHSSWRLLPVLWFVPVAVAIAVIDLRTFIVPTRIVWPALGVSLVLSGIAAGLAREPRWLLGGAIGFATMGAPLLLLWLIAPGGMGFGDVRLGVLVGWTVGFGLADQRAVASVYGIVVCFIVAAVAGLLFGFVVIGARGLKAKVPFGPPLVGSALLCLGLAAHIHSFFKV